MCIRDSRWIEPCILEDVTCNKCTLLNRTSRTPDVEELLLSGKYIEDEDMIKLKIIPEEKKKGNKLRNSYMVQLPHVMSFHINRSRFHKKTFKIRKDNRRVLFKLQLTISDLYSVQSFEGDNEYYKIKNNRQYENYHMKLDQEYADDEEFHSDNEEREEINEPKSRKYLLEGLEDRCV